MNIEFSYKYRSVMLEKIWTSRIVSRYLIEFCRWFYYSFKNLGPLRIYPTNKVLEGSAEWANVTLDRATEFKLGFQESFPDFCVSKSA